MKDILCLIIVLTFPFAGRSADWQLVELPSEKAFTREKGFATYRCFVKIPKKWQDLTVMLWLDKTIEVDEAYTNGFRIGANGSLDIYSKPASAIRRPYIISEDLIKFGEYNLLSVRCLAKKGSPAILGTAVLIAGDELITLNGQWEFKKGDNKSWHTFQESELKNYLENVKKPVGSKGIEKDTESILQKTLKSAEALFENNVHHNARVIGSPKKPQETLNSLTVKDLKANLAAHEPDVSQPIQVKFDEQGRMWVVQFRQYPEPAGLRTVGMDKYLRKVFDRKLPPPPYDGNRFSGNDKITWHEDKDGDGFYESTETFIDGLNITTALEFDKNGIWVLSPPHLLFYKDENRDNKPDSKTPEVHLSGFNLEDTHAVANSLTLGPDGWLYGVTGSTTTGSVKVLLNGSHPKVDFLGQTVWRYHREKKVFELFSEGGYNNFGLDFDERGHVFSGTNGRTGIVHFVQGGYFRKNLGKHGPHNNYYPYEMLDTLKDKTPKRARMIHQWLPYLGGSIPELKGKFIGPNSLSNIIDVFSIDGMSSTYQCKFDYSLVTSKDRWFRPVHITSGPDGALYISDWYDSRITHLDPRDNWDKTHGRIYRIQKAGVSKPEKIGLKGKSSSELIKYFSHGDHWYRRTALRLISENQDKSIIPELIQNIKNGHSSLESLWALYNLKALNNELLELSLNHKQESIREWAVRLITDFENVEIAESVFSKLINLAENEKSPYVLSQLAASAKRMTVQQSAEIVSRLLSRSEISQDPRLKIQIWWALERLISNDSRYLVSVSKSSGMLNSEESKNDLADFIGRRLISDPSEKNIDTAILILKTSGADFRKNFIRGLKKGSEGRTYQLNDMQISEFDSLINDETLKARLLGDSYKKKMISKLNEAKTVSEKLNLLKSIGATNDKSVLKVSLDLFPDIGDKDKKLVLDLLAHHNSAEVAKSLLANYSKNSAEIKYSIIQLLASRKVWTLALLKDVEKGQIPKTDIKGETKLVIQNNNDTELKSLYESIWPSTSSEVEKEVARVLSTLKSGKGNKDSGEKLFTAFCSSCHKLNGKGGFIGPDLSGYELHNKSFIVPAVVNPNLAIREGYELTQIQLKSGLTVSGFIKEQTDSILKVQKLDGQSEVISKSSVLKESKVTQSMMPEGLTKSLNDEQIRDLFEYLKSQSGVR